jgi:hypothetical protein
LTVSNQKERMWTWDLDKNSFFFSGMDFLDLLEIECLTIITRISCLIVYYKLILSPISQTILDNCKKLYELKHKTDFSMIYLKLSKLEESLMDDVSRIYEPFFQNTESPYDRLNYNPWG